MPSAKKTGGAPGGGKIRTPRRAVPAKRPAKRTAPAKTRASGSTVEETAGPERVLEPTPAGRAEAPARRPAAGRTITIVQYASGIACPKRQKRVLRSLGLRHPHHTVVRPDNAAVRGMVQAIPHLVRIVESERGA